MKCRVMKSLHGRACAPACRIVFILIDRKSQEKMHLSQFFFVESEKTKVTGVRRGEERARKGFGVGRRWGAVEVESMKSRRS